jgi:hypothetical protein
VIDTLIGVPIDCSGPFLGCDMLMSKITLLISAAPPAARSGSE